MRFLFILFLLPGLAWAQTSPTDYIRQNVDAVLSIITAPEYQDATSKDEMLRRLEVVVDNFFDAQELSKRAVAQHWRLFTEPQREEFQQLFLALIKSVYLKRSLEYTDEVVIYNQEILKSETLAEVYTTVTSSKLNVPVTYFLIKREGVWRVYDVSVENVSLVRNYRSQFQSILQRNTPEQLIAILREKANE